MEEPIVPAATVELLLTDNLRRAIEHVFEEARASLRTEGGLVPFAIVCTQDGFDESEHPGATSDEVYESVRDMLARDMPEAYALAYDGFVETDEGRGDAILCEAAKRGDPTAYLLALPYEADEGGGFKFAPVYFSAGEADVLYPRGVRPLVSGLVERVEERRAEHGAELKEE